MTRPLTTRWLLAGVFALASAPAQAAGVDAPPIAYAMIALWMVVWLGVPAAGFGYILGHFVSLRTALLITAALAILPLLVLWAARSTPGWSESVAVMAFLLPALSLLVWLGWRIAHRETQRTIERAS